MSSRCQYREGTCEQPAITQNWVFVSGGIVKLRLCGTCSDELAENGRQRWNAEQQAAIDSGEPPEGSEVVVVGGKYDGLRYHRRDSTKAIEVALGCHHRWWDEIEALHADWEYRRKQVEASGGRLVLVVDGAAHREY